MTPVASFNIAGSLNSPLVVPSAETSDLAPTNVARLTHGLAAGDENAFREFHARYFDRLYQFLLVVTRGESHAAQDALQETLLRVARYARPFADEEIFWSWLKAIARNTARDGGRKRRRYLARLRDFALGRPALFADELHSEPDLLRSLLAETIADLPALDRRLIEGKYSRGETVGELALQTGLTEKAVESRLSRARERVGISVRKKLNPP